MSAEQQSDLLTDLRDPRFVGQEGMRARAADQIERLQEALRWYSNMLDGREHLPHSQRTEITYGELWIARKALLDVGASEGSK